MKKFPKIIDNTRVDLLNSLISVSANFNEISIATGYWDLEATALLLPHLKKYKKIRLLIGREPLIPRHQLNEVEPDFPDKDIFEDLQKLKIDSNLKPTVKELKQLVDNKILEVKIFKKAFLHAKCYIFGNFESETAIGVIGSSNFTKNGITSNRELNAGEDDQRVVQFNPKNKNQEHGHLSWFEEVWTDEGCVEWTGKFIELVDTSVHGELLFSPYEMYIKTLDYMYGDLLKEDREIEALSDRKLQNFQERSVKQILWRLDKNGVAMLADSVGLGKTITAIGVISQYTGRRIIVIAPKSLVGQWENEIAREKLLGITVISMQNKNQIDEERKKDKYMPISLFVIDESHNLRSHNSKRFQQISEWLVDNSDANTLLLTATPVNNSIDDLTNQILLGTRGEQDLLQVNVRNSEGVIKSRSFFDALFELKKRISQNRAQGNDMKPIYKEARQVIDPILREFVIRNTRQSIEEELDGKGLEIDGKEFFFPKIKVSNETFNSGDYQSIIINSAIEAIENNPVEKIQETTDVLVHPLRQLEELNDNEIDISDKSIIYRLYQYILALSFIPYRTSMYDYKVYGKSLEEIKNIKFTKETKKKIGLQLSMYGLLRIVWLKRFESSSYALLESVKKYQKRLKTFEDILSQENLLLNLSDIDDILDEYEAEDGENIDLTDDEIIEKAKKLGVKISTDSHNINAIKEDLALEKKILIAIVELTEQFKSKDKKLEVFLKKVTEIAKDNPNKKILVFSFFADTVRYLKENVLNNIENIFNEKNSEFVSGKEKANAMRSAERFAPVAKDARDRVSKEKELTYLFSTDVLAEGQNLQDCGLLINYDLHWNPVRMIQRNGRINRLGSPHSEVEVINIVPNKELDQFLGLVTKLEDKISLINATIGSDSSVLGEQINPIHYKGIYDTDSNTATVEYLRLEKEADVFTDDQFISDLKHFREQTTSEIQNSIEKIPLSKWGVVDQSKILQSPEVLVFSQSEFSNNQKQFTFYRNNKNNNALDILLTGEALQILRSNDQERKKDNISLDKKLHLEYVSKNGPQITRFDNHIQRLTPSQQTILDEAMNVGWGASDRARLESLLMTRNVFHGRIARKLTKQLREVIREGKLSERDIILEKIKKILPEERQTVKVVSVNPIFGFSRENN
ncbi:MAG: SNF2-related protein [Patescibacteria group bacterium]|nr:SNF2-related protein [Patescibacteria group bacterium]